MNNSPIDMSEYLEDIEVPDISCALQDLKNIKIKEQQDPVDLFAEKKRKGWDKSVEARCDFSRKIRITRRSGIFFLTLWQKTLYGRTLTDIKSDDTMVDYFADNLAPLLTDVLGPQLKKGDWCMITTPPRRHKERNFATRTMYNLSRNVNIPCYEGCCSCRSRQRVNTIFDVHVVPKEQNIICFDDIVTTGQTLLAMKKALEPYGKNIFFFAGINNKL
jgi:hypothetical protein